jgi:hypothetical protein
MDASARTGTTQNAVRSPPGKPGIEPRLTDGQGGSLIIFIFTSIEGFRMNDSSRSQGGLICIAVVILGLLFLKGVLSGSYVALAIPITILVAFFLGLAFWVGWTIYTIHVEPEIDDEDGDPASE